MAKLMFAVYLLWVAKQDQETMQVVRYSHLPGVAAVLALALRRGAEICAFGEMYLIAFLGMALVQIWALRERAYGLADVFVFYLCGVFFVVSRGISLGVWAHMFHMAVSVLLLWIKQKREQNLKSGALTRPVPYIPYICCAFFLTNMVL